MRTVLLFVGILFICIVAVAVALFRIETAYSPGGDGDLSSTANIAAGLPRSAAQPATTFDALPPVILYDPTSGLNPNWAVYNIAPFPDQPSDLGQVTASDGLWYGSDRVALLEEGQWIELTCNAPSFLVGVHFWGDENDGYARVSVDGAEVWHDNTYGPVGVQFNRRLEAPHLSGSLHTLRIEATGQNGGPGGSGNDDVTIYLFSCSVDLPYKLFLPCVWK